MARLRREQSVEERLRELLGDAAYAEYFGGAAGAGDGAAEPRPERRPVSGPDPVAVVLADAAADGPLVQRVDGEDPTLADLPAFIHVEEYDDRIGRLDTTVWFDDEIHLYADPYESGLEDALAEQPHIEEVSEQDREVWHLRTPLALEDVRAAVVRAVVEVNRRPSGTGPTR